MIDKILTVCAVAGVVSAALLCSALLALLLAYFDVLVK